MCNCVIIILTFSIKTKRTFCRVAFAGKWLNFTYSLFQGPTLCIYAVNSTNHSTFNKYSREQRGPDFNQIDSNENEESIVCCNKVRVFVLLASGILFSKSRNDKIFSFFPPFLSARLCDKARMWRMDMFVSFSNDKNGGKTIGSCLGYWNRSYRKHFHTTFTLGLILKVEKNHQFHTHSISLNKFIYDTSFFLRFHSNSCTPSL